MNKIMKNIQKHIIFKNMFCQKKNVLNQFELNF